MTLKKICLHNNEMGISIFHMLTFAKIENSNRKNTFLSRSFLRSNLGINYCLFISWFKIFFIHISFQAPIYSVGLVNNKISLIEYSSTDYTEFKDIKTFNNHKVPDEKSSR